MHVRCLMSMSQLDVDCHARGFTNLKVRQQVGFSLISHRHDAFYSVPVYRNETLHLTVSSKKQDSSGISVLASSLFPHCVCRAVGPSSSLTTVSQVSLSTRVHCMAHYVSSAGWCTCAGRAAVSCFFMRRSALR